MAATEQANADARFFAQAGRRSWLPPLVAVAVAWLALWWMAPALTLGLRNDDFLIPYYIDSETGAVIWGRVFEEFGRGWFGAPALYRPMISLSLALEYSCTGSLPSLHLGNVLMLAVAAAATAMLAARLAAGGGLRAALAGLVAGALVVLHPAAVEPGTWILSRTTALQMAFTALALWSFVRSLDGGARWPHLLLLALALCSKEGAVTAPFSMLLLDFVHRRDVTFSLRLRAALPALGLLGGYFALRLALLGLLGKSGDPVGLLVRGENLLARAGDLYASAAPGGGRPWWMLLLWGGVAAGVLRGVGWRGLLLLPWAVLLVAPASHVEVIAGRLDGRLLFDAVPFVAVAAGLAVGRCRRDAVSVLGAGAAVAVVLAQAPTARAWQQTYVDDHLVDRAVHERLAEAAASATGDRPLAVIGLPVLPLYHFKLWGLLGQRPHHREDLHVVGLPDLLFAPNDQPEQRGDASAVHALLACGGRVATWQPQARQLVDVAAPLDGSCALVRQGPGFAPEAPWSGTSVAAVHVQLPRGSDGQVVRVRPAADVPGAPPTPWLEQPLVDGGAWFDTSRWFAPILFQSVGVPFAGVLVEVQGGPPPDDVVVTVHGRSEQVALVPPVAGAEVALDALGARIVPPEALQHDLRLHLVMPTGVRSQRFDGAAAAPLDAVLQDELRYAWELAAPLDVQWFWTGRKQPGGRPCVTPLDWARVR